MSKYLIKICALALVTIFVNFCLSKAVPYYTGNQELTDKMWAYNKEKDKINCVFLGNSQINKHLNPEVFDKENNNTTHSFNLASNSTPFLELNYITENVLKTVAAENVFMIISRSAPIREENLYKPRVNYYHNGKTLRLALGQNKGIFKQIRKHTISYILNQLSPIYKLRALIKDIRSPYAQHYKRGYLSYESEARHGLTVPEPRPESDYFRLASATKVKYNVNKELDEEEQLIERECQKLSRLSLQMNKQLYFIFLPNDQNYLHMDLPNKLYLGDGETFPEFYQRSYRYNPNHLTEAGAMIFSKKLAIAYQAQLQSTQ